jgi:hypothetical protein
MGALAAGFLFLLGADWSGALVRPGVAGPWRSVPSHLSHNCVGVVGGALASWGPVVQLARSVDVTTSHTTTMGSWEVHSDVGLVSAGWLRCCFVWNVSGAKCKWGDSGWVSSIFRLVTPTGSGLSWWYTAARVVAGTYLCVVAVLRFPLLDRP